MAKVSKTKIDELIKICAPSPTVLSYDIAEGTMVHIEVTPSINHIDFGRAVKECANMQFALDKETGDEVYAPYLKPFAVNYVILKYFTNLNVDVLDGAGEMDSKAVERLWSFMNCTSVMNDIEDSLGDIYYTLHAAIDELVEEKKIQLRPGAAKLWSDLGELVESYKQQFGEISSDDAHNLTALIDKLSGIDDETIVKAMR